MLGPQAQAVRRERQSKGLAHLEAHGVHSRSAERIERLHVRRQVGGMGIEYTKYCDKSRRETKRRLHRGDIIIRSFVDTYPLPGVWRANRLGFSDDAQR